MSLMLEQDYTAEAESAEKQSFGRTVARVLMLSVVVTALVAGLYMAFGGNSGTDPLATGANSPAVTDNAAKPAAAKPQLTYEEKAAAAADKLKGVSVAGRRTALINYLGKVGIKVTPASSPATAATTACDFLKAGTAPKTMINEVAAGGGYSKQQSKAFLLGASTLYCDGYAKNFR